MLSGFAWFFVFYIFLWYLWQIATLSTVYTRRFEENHSDLSFTLSAGHLVGHLTHPWIKLLNGLLVKDYFAAFCFSQDLE